MLYALRLLTLAVSVSLACAAAPDTLWTHLYGGSSWDQALGGAPDLSGGFLLVGQTQSFGPAGQNGFITQTSGLNGDSVFTRWYGGAASDNLSDIHVAFTQMLAVGATSSFGANPSNAYLVCVNAIGDTIWTRTIDSGGDESALAVDHYTDYFIAGWTAQSGQQPDLMVAKVTDTGTVLWTRTLGGAGLDQANDVVALADGGCVVAGLHSETTQSYAWLVRYDANGDTLWTRIYGEPNRNTSANEVVVAPDGGFVLAGYKTFPSFDDDVYLVKTDASGNLEWSQTYGSTAGDESALDIWASCSGGYVLGGYTDSYGAGGRDMYLIRVDANGDTLWTKTMGGTDDDLCYTVYHKCYLDVTDEGYFGGGTTESYGLGQADAWLVRLDSDPLLTVTSPDACFTAQIGESFTVQWQTHSNKPNRFVRIELNRDYPNGTWELLTASTWDDGTETFTATAPASNHCRVRVTTLFEPTIEAVNPGDFVIHPLGNLQFPIYNWQTNSANYYTGYFNDVVPAESGYITCGHIYSTEFSPLISKVDTLGNFVWSNTILGPNDGDGSLRRLIHWHDSLYLAVGSIAPNDSVSHVFVQAITESGNEQGAWGGINGSGGTDICLTDDGGFLVAGSYINNSFLYPYISRTNPSGTLVWYDILNLDTVSIILTACQPVGNDEYMLAGTRGVYIATDSTHPVLIKVDGDGAVLWYKTYPDSVHPDLVINDMAVLPTGDIVLVGKTWPASGGSAFYYLVLDANGEVLHRWTHAPRNENEAEAITIDVDGGIVVSGHSNYFSQSGDMLLVKHRCDGTLVWSLFFGFDHDQHGYGVCTTPDGGYLMAGGSVYCPGGPLCAEHDHLIKAGGEQWVVPPACPQADSLVVQYLSQTNSVRLTWSGEETGVYRIYATTSTAENGDPPGNGWSEIGCFEPVPPAATIMQWTDPDPSPLYKRYTVIHDCAGSCGGSN